MQEFIQEFFVNWASFYSNHAAMRTLIGFLHIGGLLIGGGLAISADRMTLRAARRGASERASQLSALGDTHRIVLVSLVAVMISGFLLFAADSENFLHSILFWVKMGLVGALMANGFLLIRAERRAAVDADNGWKWLTIASTISVALWMLTTLAGAALPNA